MNKEDIIRMAREAGATPYTNCHYPDRPTHTFNPEQLERFAALVYAEAHQHGLDDFEATVLPVAIAAEREACAKVCEDDCGNGALNLADAIRARGQA